MKHLNNIVIERRYDLTFKAKIDSLNIDIEGRDSITNHKDFDLMPSEFYVEFEIDIEYRDWGIKDIAIYPTKINGSVFITDIETNQEEEIICNDFEIESDFEDKIPLTIQALEINLKDKIIYVS